jgi:hypothetical protein
MKICGTWWKFGTPIFAIWVCLAGPFAATRADEFARLEGPSFFELASGPDLTPHAHLTVSELESLPTVLRDERSALLIVKTDQGNLAKLLVSPGMHNAKPSNAKPSPKDGPKRWVLVVERFETIDGGDHRSIKARGAGLTLFDGFQLDLDTGQVVPNELGGDLLFTAQPPLGPRVAVLPDARLLTLNKPPPAPARAPGQPSPGRAVLAADFAGRYTLVSNGQWTGTLVLAIGEGRNVTGHFASDRNGSAYEVTGQVAADVPQKIEFTIQFPRAKQNYSGTLWTEDKQVIAGTMTMLERPFSFVAIREGGSLRPGTVELGAGPVAGAAPEKRRVVRLNDPAPGLIFDGRSLAEADLAAILAKDVKAEHVDKVILEVPRAVKFERIKSAVDAIRAVGIRSIELVPAPSQGDAE